MASAHVDVGIGICIPGPVFIPAQPVYEAPPPVVYAPAPVAAYGYGEDWRERDGRLSWRAPKDVVAERPWLNADVLVRRRFARG